MENSIILNNVSIDDLKGLISESFESVINKFRPQEPEKQDDQLIKIDEVAKMLNVSKVTVFAWKKAGKFPFYRISNKIYFRKNEILSALKKIN
ncbi:MAG: helix-turn-helix domain-containing protein [bacterium]